MRLLSASSSIAALVLLFGPAVEASASSADRGLMFVETNCSMCHAIGREDESPLAIAPPFRTLHELYPVEYLEEALAEGIVTGHPSMPEFELDEAQIDNLIAYLKTLE